MKKLHIQKQLVTAVLYPVLFGIVFIVLWQTKILHDMLGTDAFTLPLPFHITMIIRDNFSTIMTNVRATVFVALAGLILGSLLGFILAMIASVFTHWGMGGLTIATAFNAIPIIAIAPVFTNLTKNFSPDPNIRSMFAKILVVMITCTVSMGINAYRGFTEVKPFSIDLMKSYAASKLTILLKLRLPNCLPYIFTALRISVPGCVISAMVSEYFAEYIIGVGRQIRENIVLAQYSTAWAYIVTACFVGIIFYVVLLCVESLLLKNRGTK